MIHQFAALSRRPRPDRWPGFDYIFQNNPARVWVAHDAGEYARDGQPVVRWPTWTGFDLDLTPTGSNGPILTRDGINGAPAIQTGGTHHLGDSSSSNSWGGQGDWLFIVKHPPGQLRLWERYNFGWADQRVHILDGAFDARRRSGWFQYPMLDTVGSRDGKPYLLHVKLRNGGDYNDYVAVYRNGHKIIEEHDTIFWDGTSTTNRLVQPSPVADPAYFGFISFWMGVAPQDWIDEVYDVAQEFWGIEGLPPGRYYGWEEEDPSDVQVIATTEETYATTTEMTHTVPEDVEAGDLVVAALFHRAGAFGLTNDSAFRRAEQMRAPGFDHWGTIWTKPAAAGDAGREVTFIGDEDAPMGMQLLAIRSKSKPYVALDNIQIANYQHDDRPGHEVIPAMASADTDRLRLGMATCVYSGTPTRYDFPWGYWTQHTKREGSNMRLATGTQRLAPGALVEAAEVLHDTGLHEAVMISAAFVGSDEFWQDEVEPQFEDAGDIQSFQAMTDLETMNSRPFYDDHRSYWAYESTD